MPTLGQRIGFPGSEPKPAAPKPKKRNPLNEVADGYMKMNQKKPKDDVPELNKKAASDFVKGFMGK